MNDDAKNAARAVSFISVANAISLVCETVRTCTGNDSADPDVNGKAFPVGLEEAVAARLNSRWAVKDAMNAPLTVVEGN